MARGTRAYTRRLLCSVCETPCDTRRGLASHHKQSRECFNALLKRSEKSSARAKRTAQNRQRRSPHSPSPPALPDDDIPNPVPEHPDPPPRQHRYVSLEEIPDEDLVTDAVIDYHPYAGAVYEGVYPMAWEQRRAADVDAKREPWHSFNSMEDWDVAKWLMTSGVSQAEMNKFLQLAKVRL